MNIKLIVVGKTDTKELISLIDFYTKKINHYVSFAIETIPDVKASKKLTLTEQKNKEAELILKKITPNDALVILDENGKNFSSIEFSAFLQKKMNSGLKTLQFLIGGPYGFSEKIYLLPHEKLALSKMTFSHQMIRLLFAEQLYRGYSILKNEPYHHQ
jgi:23S rRNA (pseudouridine1915-N3)-methyltransferase